MDQEHPVAGRVFRQSDRLSRKVLVFMRSTGLIIPVAEDCWIYSPAAEEQLAAMIADELLSDQPDREESAF